MRLLQWGILVLMPSILFAAENVCRAADLMVHYPRSILVGPLDSIRASDPDNNEDLTYGANGLLVRRIRDHDTLDYQWAGSSVRYQSRSELEFEVAFLNDKRFPDSIVHYDSSGQSTWRETFRYGDDFVVRHDSETDEVDSAHFSTTGMQYFINNGELIRTCQTVAQYCSCRSEDSFINDSVTIDFYSTGGFLDSILVSTDNWLRFYWNRSQAPILTVKPRRIHPVGVMMKPSLQRDLMGRARHKKGGREGRLFR